VIYKRADAKVTAYERIIHADGSITDLGELKLTWRGKLRIAFKRVRNWLTNLCHSTRRFINGNHCSLDR